MAAKKTEVKETVANIEPMKSTVMDIELIGDSDLILHGRSRYYVQSEVWKQEHPKGAEMPKIFQQDKNTWEGLITSIHWLNPIEFHDEDISLYTEEEWMNYMNPENNKPCILSQAFKKSFTESFITFYRDSTGKAGTDFKRSLSVKGEAGSKGNLIPIDFDNVTIEKAIVPTKGIGGSSVVCSTNVFSNWRCKIKVTCPNISFPYQTILSIISATGEYIGIGTQRSNDFGRYHIGNIEVTEIQ